MTVFRCDVCLTVFMFPSDLRAFKLPELTDDGNFAAKRTDAIEGQYIEACEGCVGVLRGTINELMASRLKKGA